MSREDIYAALFALVSPGEGQPGLVAAGWSGSPGGFAYTSRRVKLWHELPVQPALCQAEHGEEITQVTQMPPRRTLQAAWIVYHQAGADRAATPASTNNAILDALEAVLAPPPGQAVQTLGGLVHHCFLSGRVFKDPGDLNGQGMVIAPITLLVP